MKTLLNYFTQLFFFVCFSTVVESQIIDSIYIYNSDGTKNWWFLQPDVLLYKTHNDAISPLLTDPLVVDLVNYYQNDRRRFNEFLLSDQITQLDYQTLKNDIITSGNFGFFAPAITKSPLLSYDFEQYIRTDDRILVTFNDPYIDNNAISAFAAQYNLVVDYYPPSSVNPNFNWTHVFRIKPQGDTVLNSILISNQIYENEPILVQFCQPNLYSMKSLCSDASEVGVVLGGIMPTWHIENSGGVIWSGYNGTIDADADICECWAQNFNGSGIKVGLIDEGGFEFNHPDLSILTPGYNAVTNLVFSSSTYTNSDGHGMQTAGIIGATANNDNLGQRYAVGVANGC